MQSNYSSRWFWRQPEVRLGLYHISCWLNITSSRSSGATILPAGAKISQDYVWNYHTFFRVSPLFWLSKKCRWDERSEHETHLQLCWLLLASNAQNGKKVCLVPILKRCWSWRRPHRYISRPDARGPVDTGSQTNLAGTARRTERSGVSIDCSIVYSSEWLMRPTLVIARNEHLMERKFQRIIRILFLATSHVQGDLKVAHHQLRASPLWFVSKLRYRLEILRVLLRQKKTTFGTP